MRSKLLFFYVLLLIIIVGFYSCVYVKAQSNAASSTISVAKSRLITCFEETKTAESAGGNISSLIDTLNNAGLLISNAEAAFANGDFSSAERLALTGQNLLNNFESKADLTKVAGQQAVDNDFFTSYVGSLIGILLVIISGLVIWQLLKRHYLVR